MTAARQLSELIDKDYYKFYMKAIERVKSCEVSYIDIMEKLKKKKIQIDDFHEVSEFFDLHKAEQLRDWSEVIMQDLYGYSQDAQWELMAAVLYFVDDADGIPDSDPLCGLDDDFEVMNAVLERHKIKLI